jgi:branched-chain amino acid aminotransferase
VYGLDVFLTGGWLQEGAMATKYKHNKVWLNGSVVDPNEATVTVFTATAMRGANVYEGIRFYWNVNRQNLFVWKLEPHLQRLFRSMRIMRMTPPLSLEEYKNAVVSWARGNEFREDVHCRLVTYFGDGGLADVKQFKPEEIEIGVWIAGGVRLHGGSIAEHNRELKEGIEVCVSSWRRINDDATPPRVKAGSNYQNSRMASVEARVNGYHTAIILTRDGKVSEGPGANVMMVRDGELITPPVSAGILEGITRATLLELFHRNFGRPPIARDIDRSELYVADEVFLCGSAEEVKPVVSVDRILIGDGSPGPITKGLQSAYFSAVRGEDPTFSDMLTPVY